MLRAIGNGEAGLLRKRLYPSLCLRELFEKHETRRCGQGARDEGVFFKQGQLRAD